MKNNKSARNVNQILEDIFSTHGAPSLIFADNVPFNSFECKQLARVWNFKWLYSAPHYHQSNGVAERAVQTCKQLMRKAQDKKLDFKVLLLEYRNTPVIDNYSPAQLLFGRLCKTQLPAHDSLYQPALKLIKDVFRNILLKIS